MKHQPPHPQRYYARFKEPPNERVRVEMFLEAADDYASLQQTFPLPDLPSGHNGAVSDRLYWVVVLHAALLRKFFAYGEQTELHRVIGAARSRFVTDNPRVAANLMEMERFAKSTTVPSRLADTPEGGSVSAWERVIIDLYGRHLHSDFGKWHASKRFLHRSNTIRYI
ncbi:MAG: hypothetical protein WED09_05515 [Homoserinimonas sp.]